MPSLLGKGLYSPSEAARWVGITPSRARRWIRGYSYEYLTTVGKKRGHSNPVIRSDVPSFHDQMALSFLELIELLVVRAFLDRGVSMRTIRLGAKWAAKFLGVSHPFASHVFKTDGRSIFMDIDGDFASKKQLLEVSRMQYAFPEVLDEYLEKVEFDLSTSFAVRWWPLGKDKPIVLDPDVVFGLPTIAGTRIPVQAVCDARRAGETKKDICFWYDLDLKQVKYAIAFGMKKGAA